VSSLQNTRPLADWLFGSHEAFLSGIQVALVTGIGNTHRGFELHSPFDTANMYFRCLGDALVQLWLEGYVNPLLR
jgi:hypothetical protein